MYSYYYCKVCKRRLEVAETKISLGFSIGEEIVLCQDCYDELPENISNIKPVSKQFNPNEMIEAKAKEYGDFRKRMQIEADMWSGFLSLKLGMEVKLTMADVGIMYCLGKISRQGFKDKQDNLEDAATYMMLAVKSREEK